jgi:Ca2+-binding EF-hand superfamily protein
MTQVTDCPFSGLWGFLAAWRALFDRFDADKSGNISFQEFQNSLAGTLSRLDMFHWLMFPGNATAFGYRLSPQFVQLLFRSYDRRGQDSSPQPTQKGGDGSL